jgi:triosephosphate isomerase
VKQYLIAGNWKMNTNIDEAVELSSNIREFVRLNKPTAAILICPPFINLFSVKKSIEDVQIFLGAQNCFYEAKGAFTGEISPLMLTSAGCTYVILGHSERRKIFGETNEVINKKVNAAIAAGLRVVLCIGETELERKSGLMESVVTEQLEVCLKGLTDEQFSNIVIAYEPVWAIGTGIAATIAEITDAHLFIRKKLIQLFSKSGRNTLILYGGSVDDSNAESILAIKEVYGALIGGASLKADKFINIIKYADRAAQNLN